MSGLFAYVKLVADVIRRGRLPACGPDFAAARHDALKGLESYIPERTAQMSSGVIGYRNAYVRGLAGQLAFFKTAIHPPARHLSACRLSYIRIPKAASTALCNAMLTAKHPELRRAALSPTQINFLADLHLSKSIDPDERNNTFFTAVRNPFSRIVSVYRSFFEGDNAFLYEDYLFGILEKGLSFPEFVRRLRRIPEPLMDQHFMPQQRLLSYYRTHPIDIAIFRIEEPPALAAFLDGYGLLFSHLNAGSTYDYRDHFDPETLSLVRDIYSADIAAFGYQDDYLRLQEYVDSKAGRSNLKK